MNPPSFQLEVSASIGPSIMGALTNNRKCGDDSYLSLASFSPPIDQSYGHVSKKSKLSVSKEQYKQDDGLPAASNSSVSRISRYPKMKTEFSREVHAPVKNSRFWPFSLTKNTEIAGSSKESSAYKMGTFSGVSQLYEKMRDVAMRSLKYFVVKGEGSFEKQKAKEVFKIDSEEENQDDLSDDSQVVELEIMAFVGTKRKGGQWAVENSDNLNVKMVEKEVCSWDSSVVRDLSNANAKVDNGEKVGSMQSDQASDDSWVPSYKRLFEWTKKRDGKLSILKFDIELTEKLIQGFHLLRPQKKEVQIKKNVAEECFTPLTEEEEGEVSRALSNFNRRKDLVNHENSNIDITGEILQCLRPGAWLNDEVINLYLELLKEREKREPQKFLKCHFFNTFFYKKLTSGRRGYNFQSVRRWTMRRKLGYHLIDCDKIFVPIHKEVHWCLAIINKKDEKFQYLDPLKGVDTQVLDVLARYFADEANDKCEEDIDTSSWDQEFVMDLPEQANGFDCGMFIVKYADFYSRDIGLCFSQEHMPYFRLRTAKEILKLRAE